MNIKLTLEPNEHGKHIFHPGHMLKGMVILTLLRTKKFRGIYIKIYGRARTFWTKQGTYVDSQAYESLEVYIDSNLYLVGPKDGPTFELQPGTHKYNFSYQLHEKLPSSINLKYGNIAYFVEAVPDVPWMFTKEVKYPFIVARCDDLNLYRNLKEPLEVVETKALLSNTHNGSNLLRMTVNLPCSGFVAGQNVSMTILYENDSDTKVLKTTVTFNQKVEFRSSTIPQLKIEEYRHVEVHADGVNAKKSKSISISFKIPNVASSNRKYSRIITVSYYIEVLGDLGREHASLKVKIPVTIGDIPIRSNEENLSVEPSAPLSEPLSGIISELLSALPSAPPIEVLMNDLPPSYEDAMKTIQSRNCSCHQT